MRAIYEPNGAAREYAALAANLYTGCPHGCRYCYAPAVLRKSRAEFSENVTLREGVIEQFEKDARKLEARGCEDEVLLCFTCDPYPSGLDTQPTRRALEILAEHRLRGTVLTKRPGKAIRDFEILQETGYWLGVSLNVVDEYRALYWEPNAECPALRMAALERAHDQGISTWVSLEPVVFPDAALRVIQETHGYVDLYRVGKLNHFPDVEKTIDWGEFLRRAVDLLENVGARYEIKRGLAAYGLLPK